MGLSRRELLRSGTAAAGALAFGPAFLRSALAAPATAGRSPYGPLQPPDANSLMLPPGFSSRLVARGLSPVAGTGYVLPVFPDGQATYRTQDGGWILVTNSESLAPVGAGASAIRFSNSGEVVDAYRILGGTNVNCAGGPTPWGTWLSCEEHDSGLVWECDPAGVHEAEARPALGAFNHEAVAVDPVDGRLYLTEDEGEGRFYRFTPSEYPDLRSGVLEVAEVGRRGRVRWHAVPDPSTAQTGVPTRAQVARSTPFDGGEGIWYARGVCYFTTKGDKRVWAYDARERRIEKVFDRARAEDSSLDAVDNVTVTAVGDVLVCEDGGNMEIGLITSDRRVSPLLRFDGSDHERSEVCGVVFDPSGTRLYCTSQRAFPLVRPLAPGAIYEITGPFRRPDGGIPEDFVFGPPAGEARPQGPLNPGADAERPRARVSTRARVSRASFLERGITVRVRVEEAASVVAVHDTHALEREPGRGGSSPRPKTVRLARARGTVERAGGTVTLRLRPARAALARLRRDRGRVPTRVLVSVRDGAGNERVLTERVRIGAVR